LKIDNLWRLIAHRHWITLKFLGNEIRLCARCTGYIIGLFTVLTINNTSGFSIFSTLNDTYQLILCILLVIPLAFDWITQTWEFRKSNNRLRFLTGLILGLGVALLSFSVATSQRKIILCVGLSVGITVLGLLGKMVRKHYNLPKYFLAFASFDLNTLYFSNNSS